MQMQAHIGFLYFVTEVKLFVSIVLVLNIFLTKFKKVIRNKNIKANIFQIRAKCSMMCGHFCIGFIGSMLESKRLTDFMSLFSPDDFEENGDITFEFFQR